jgi:hypothetical protein
LPLNMLESLWPDHLSCSSPCKRRE